MHLQPDALLQGGKYKIERELGHGGFGITYLAVQIGLNRRVAIKEFFMSEYCNRDAMTSHVTIGSEGSRELVERSKAKFVKEAQTIAEMDNAHIIPIYDVFEENGTAYYVMKYIDGGSLNDMTAQGPLSVNEALLYIRQVADALLYCHARKILHLDVKPSNVLVQDGIAVLIDFGIAKHYDEVGSQTSSTPIGISRGYAPLEQYNRSGVCDFSPVTDIYSLGATFYKLVVGVTPPDANEVNEEGLLTFPQHIPNHIKESIVHAMQPRRKDRPQSIKAFLSLLEVKTVNDEETKLISSVGELEGKTCIQDNKREGEKNKDLLKYLWIIVVVCLTAGLTIILMPPSAKKLYEQGVSNIEQNQALAIEQIQKSAGKGYAEAQFYLGHFYYYQQDYLKAIEWLEVAAEQGHKEAQYYLGECYYYGTGVKQDCTKAVILYQESAYQGVTESQFSLGYCYYFGEGIEQNYSKAVEWLKKAAEQGHNEAEYYLGECYHYGNGIEQDDEIAATYFLKAAKEGHTKAQSQIGHCYYFGKGVEQDYNKATEWFLKAANRGNVNAQYNLGVCYSNGHGVKLNHATAVEWYQKAAEQGHIGSQINLGVCYCNGDGTPQDYAKAVEWFRKAAEQGDADAQYNLALCYDYGRGVSKNYTEAKEWFYKAAIQGEVNSQYNLGRYYEKGYGVKRDIAISKDWYQKAADQGHSEAKKRLLKFITESELQEKKMHSLAPTGKINGHDYVDLGLSVKWATCNIGASSPSGYGGYFAWGETNTKNEYAYSNSKTNNKDVGFYIGGNVSYDAARANWGGTWRIPTKTELEELIYRCSWEETILNGCKGCRIIGPNGKSIFLPNASAHGHKDVGVAGLYWSSTSYIDQYHNAAYYLWFVGGAGIHEVKQLFRSSGLPIRPVSE